MKTIHYSPLAILALAAAITMGEQLPGRSQDTGAAPPPRPYIFPLKGDFTMVEKISYNPKSPSVAGADASGGASPQAGPQLEEVDAVETGIMRKDKQIFGDGTSSEIWRSGALRFLLNSKSPDGVLVASHEMSYYDDPPDFKDVEWVGPKSYQGVQMFGGKNCYYYVQGDQKAWIDQTTRWPLQYDSAAMHITFTYGIPSGPLLLPPICAKKLDQMKRAWAGMPN